ncbi:transcription elongation factor SPT6 [Mycena maculata]|uniref:Transcription elongation factor Spt6 n=1 Tax=Mycena maculata TaxID=230809 RepID=A0AAD7NTQ3_9AGAR|nr:transcription elongation factor SPT6 [Mycena maculata]
MGPSAGEEDEGEGDVIMPGADDSSEEEEDEDEEEARRIRDGFIVDEDEEEDEDEDRKRRRKRARHRRKQEEEEEGLEDDDLALLEENTGASFKKNRRLTRLRRGHDSESPPVASSSKRRTVVDSSDDDLDNDEPLPDVQDIQRIWDKDDDEDDGEQDMDDFIDYSDDGAAMDEQARDARRRQRRLEQDRRKKAHARPELVGIDALAWDEIHDVFGDGHEYDWALVDDDEVMDEDEPKPDTKFIDVFEPAQIRAKFLTEDDDLIRARDIPERMQLSSSTLSKSTVLAPIIPFGPQDIDDAALWVTTRISARKNMEFFSPNGTNQALRTELVASVSAVLTLLFIDNVEVPYIWAHKRDQISHFDVTKVRARSELLNLAELWKIYTLGQKYRSLLERQRALEESYTRLNVTDPYYMHEILPKMDSVEVVADTSEWLSMKYKDKKTEESRFQFHDDEELQETVKRKMPSRISAYEIAKKSVISKLAQGFGIQAHEVVLNFFALEHVHFVEDQELNPMVYAEQFVSPDPLLALPPEELLRRARMIMATELGKDPLLRQHIRDQFKHEGRVSVVPTEQGISKITDTSPEFAFKYLYQKPVRDMVEGSQFLHMLAAEAKNWITISIHLTADAKAAFERRLVDALASDSFSESAKAWNEQGSLVVQEVLEQHLLPLGAKWTREYIREEVEDLLAERVRFALRQRIDVAPFTVPGMKEDRPSVLAASWGKGDPHKDAITLVFLDPRGRMREHTKLDNLVDTEMRDEFIDLLRRRKPDVIAVGGFNMTTTKLSQRIKEIIGGLRDNASAETEDIYNTPVIYVRDDSARLFQHSPRADAEFSSYSMITKYCVGLARYVQSPLNEYAALGPDIATIIFSPLDQPMIPAEKILIACERAVIDVVNKVGVDINRAVGDAYYQTLLPFVCGLGPRKAQQLVKKIEGLGENISNREQFIRAGLLTKTLFINAAGFLRILPNEDIKPGNLRADDENAPDPLDDTRIHPEDYELARKMAMDALEYDDEDVVERHPSWVVSLIMEDPDNEKKLSELNLDDFAVSLHEANGDSKRHTLNVIRDELSRPFFEQREPYPMLEGWDVLTMLSGETPKSLTVGMIITVAVLRVKSSFVTVKLQSGIEGVINSQYFSDEPITKGKSIDAVLIDVKTLVEQDSFFVELSARNGDISAGDKNYRRTASDHYWDESRFEKDSEMLARKKRAEVDRSRRVIKHPNFHNFNTAQAEAYLDKQQRGDVVIRPSSKGTDHLAVTWKVDEQLYQHIDVTEPNADPTGQTVGTHLIVDSTHSYADLDELIVNHVQAMARKVEELMAHDRFKQGSEDDLHLYLKNSLAANPGKSMYGFTLNRKRPGHFNLCFLANKNSLVQTWPVRVTPEAYHLFDAAAVGVPELCDAFKVR